MDVARFQFALRKIPKEPKEQKKEADAAFEHLKRQHLLLTALREKHRG